jgi:acylphosphatase
MYRYWAIQEATRRRLSGWVRNRSDGSVEALFSGSKADVDSMIIACRQGPPAARVTNVVLHAAKIPDRPGFHPLATE